MTSDCQAFYRACLSHWAGVNNYLGAAGSEVGNFSNFLLRSNSNCPTAKKWGKWVESDLGAL